MLSNSEKIEVDNLINALKRDGRLSYVNRCNVTVKKHNSLEVIFSGQYSVCLNEDSNYNKINIMWEDGSPSVKNYRDYELFGYYSSSYNYMKLDSTGAWLILEGSSGIDVWINL